MAFVALITAFIFFRTHIHDHTIEDAGLIAGLLFFSPLMSLFAGLAEMTFAVRPGLLRWHIVACRQPAPHAVCATHAGVGKRLGAREPWPLWHAEAWARVCCLVRCRFLQYQPDELAAAQIERLPTFFKQRDNNYFPSW